MIHLRNKRMSRRSFLRGAAGVSLALPFLDVMRPVRALAGEPVRTRFIGFYVPCGIHMPAWTPAQVGPLALSPTLSPLSGLEPYLNVISGLDNRPARPDGNGDHAAGTGAFLTARHCLKTQGANIRNGISLDQLLAQQVGADDRFPSLVLASEGGGNAGGCDSGYSCAYVRNISWEGPQTPAARTIDPRAAFSRLFGADDAGLTPAQIAKDSRQRRSVLDYVHVEARALQGTLGARDQQKLDQYLTSVRELERQIAVTGNLTCDPGGTPAEPEDPVAHIRSMLDVIVLAFQCNLTNVATYMLGNGGSQRVFPFLGIGDNHHLVSHHLNAEANFAKLRVIDAWEMSMVSYLLNGLRSVETANGNLLDESLVFVSSEIQDGNSHAHDDMPVLLAGGANGQLQGGRHLQFDGHTPVANLFTRIAQMCGAPIAEFGDDSTGALDLG